MKAEVMTITPEMAAKMLEGNVRNRPLSKKRVQIIADAIKRGEWELNGETIILNGCRLLNGQHRLSAVVLAGEPIESFVVNGAPDKVFHTIDTGVNRSAGDVLGERGVPNARNVSASLKWVHGYNTNRAQVRATYTIPQIEAILEEHPGVVTSVTFTKKMRIVNPSLLGAAHYLFSRLDQDAANDFANQLNDGADLSVGDGVYHLRERLLADRLSKGSLSEVYKFALLIKAWNARRDGQTVRNLRWRETGPVPEAFPVIK